MKKVIKWLLIIVVSIILIVIIAGIYKFNYLANQSGYDCDGNKIEDTYKSEVLLKVFNLNSPNDFYVKIPETNTECKITELIDSLRYAKGFYMVGEEKGEVIIDNLRITALNQLTKDIRYLAIPFLISNQGSGLFKYLGTFKLDYANKTIHQIDSYFLGDRVKINSIIFDGNDKLQVDLNIHSVDQAMSEVPSEFKVLQFKVVNGTLF